MDTIKNQPVARTQVARVQVARTHVLKLAEFFHDGKEFPVKQLVLLSSDLVAILTSALIGFFVATYLRILFGISAFEGNSLTLTSTSLLAFPIVFLLFISLWRGHYSNYQPLWSENRELFETVLLTGAIFFFLSFVFNVHMSRLWIMSSLCLFLVFIPIARVIATKYLARKNLWYRPLIVLGTTPDLIGAGRALAGNFHMGYSVAAIVTLLSDERVSRDASRDLRTTTDPFQVAQNLLKQYPNPHLLLVFNKSSDFTSYRKLINKLSLSTEDLIIMPPMSDLPYIGTSLIGVPRQNEFYIHFRPGLQRAGLRAIKRVFDIVLSSLLLLILSPMLLYIAAHVSLKGGAPFYAHRRVGHMGKEFRCWKFRTMKVDADKILFQTLENDVNSQSEWENTFKLKNDPRITSIGKFLRKTSLDELPQLWNVLKGEMSLVGPRPIVTDEIARYGDDFEYYKAVLPGITGLWQVSGRSDVSYPERVNLDIWYVRNWSLWTDIVILFNTIPVLVSVKGAY